MLGVSSVSVLSDGVHIPGMGVWGLGDGGVGVWGMGVWGVGCGGCGCGVEWAHRQISFLRSLNLRKGNVICYIEHIKGPVSSVPLP